MRELVIDSFAGGGGASEGIKMALGRDPDIAVNHDRFAMAMHRRNHPGTKHLIQDVALLDSVSMCAGRPIGMLWMSPDCTDHSKAKGAAPDRTGKNTRGIGWAIVGWVKALPMWQRPRVVFLENVEEYQFWGPLLPNGKRCPIRKGTIFKQFIESWRALGYDKIEWRERRAWCSGSGTIRKRLYVIMRRDGEDIVWPEPTHGNPNVEEQAQRIAAGELKPWVTIAECIDFTLPIPSIFDTAAEIKRRYGIRAKRPLVRNTQARMAKGVKKHVLDAKKLCIIKVNHTARSEARARSSHEPLSAMTGKRDDAVVVPSITKFRSGSIGHSALEPIHTITPHASETHGGGAAPLGLLAPVLAYAQHGGGVRSGDAPGNTFTASSKDQNQIVAAYLVPRYGEREGQEPRTFSTDRPGPTPVPTGNEGNVAVVNMMTMRNSGSPTSSADQPGRTLVADGAAETVMAAFVAQHNTDMVGHDTQRPIGTIVGTGSTQNLAAVSMVSLRGSDRRDSDAAEPGRTDSASGQHNAVVSLPLMTVYYGTDDNGARTDEPGRTETAKPRFALAEVLASAPPFTKEHEVRAREVAEFLRSHGCWDGGEFVTIEIDGVTAVLVDICMRMLTPRERFTANGFRRDYVIDHGIDEFGNVIKFTLEQQGYMCGNAVCPTEAEALVSANYRPRDIIRWTERRPAPLLEAAE